MVGSISFHLNNEKIFFIQKSGGAEHSAIAPHRSFIDVMTEGFSENPQLLAKYLLELDSNSSKYSSYFWWKEHFEVLNTHHDRVNGHCEVCKMLNEGKHIFNYRYTGVVQLLDNNYT